MADVKISALTAATAAAAANELGINEAGTSKKLTVALLRDWLFANLGEFAPGSFTIPTGNYNIMTRTLILTGSQQAVVEGTGVLRIID